MGDRSKYIANIWKINFYTFLRWMHFIAGVLVPFFLVWGGISFTEVMILQAVFYISIVLLEIPTGAVADFLGRKTSLALAAFFGIVAPIVYAWTPNFYMFIIGEILWALGDTLASGANEALMYDSLKKLGRSSDSKKYFSRFNTYMMAAIMVSALIGSVIAKYLGLRYTMLLMAVPFVAAFIIALTLKEVKAEKRVERRGYIDTLMEGVKYFKGHRIIRILTFDRVSVASLVFFIIWSNQLLLKEMGVPILYFGVVFSLMAAAQIPFIGNLEFLEKIFGSKKRYLFISAMVSAVGFLLLAFVRNAPAAIIIIIVMSGCGLSRTVLFQNYTNKYIESQNRATVISAVSMMDRLIKAAIYPLLGWLAEYSLSSAFIIVGIAIIACALVSKVEEDHLIDDDAI
ncbi:MAG: MFS transporter [Deltaproteobacteria bacterium]|nr:MFS transporter [Deltaproteobacteria bacterium]